MIGSTNPTEHGARLVDSNLAEKYRFDTNIAQQLGRVVAALQNLSEGDHGQSGAEHSAADSLTLIDQLATFTSAITALGAYGAVGQRLLMKLVSGNDLSDAEAVFLEQIQHVDVPFDVRAD